MHAKPALSLPYLQLWFAHVGEISAPIEHSAAQTLTLSQRQRFRDTSNLNKRREFLLSRALMCHALDEYIKPQQQEWQFIEQPNSPPIVTNLPDNLYISLTHSKGSICFALASCSVGIDLEKMRANRDFIPLAESVMNEREISFLKQRPEKMAENFYRVWCAKEACYKARPIEQQANLSLKNIDVLPLLSCEEAKGPVLITRKSTDLMLAVILQKKVESITVSHFPKNDDTLAELVEGFNLL